MKRVQVAVFDDMEFAATGTLIEARHTIQLGWNGEWVELDLKGSNYTSLRDVLAPYLKAGHKTGAITSAAADAPGGAARRAYFKGLREWAAEQGRSYEHTTPSGSFKYPKPMIAEYDAYLLSQADDSSA